MNQKEFSKKKPRFGRDFSLMVAGQIISLFGNVVLRFALSMTVLDLTGSAAAFATISALSMVPTILLSPLGGVLADRASRKWIMAVLDFLTAGLLLAFWAFSFSGIGMTPVAAAMVVLAVIQSFYQPSVQSSVPSLVAEEDLAQANGWVAQVNALANLLGPVLGGFLYGLLGLSPILTVSAACFFLSAVMECFLRIPYEKRAVTGGLFSTIGSDFSDSVRFMLQDRREIFQLLLVVAGINLFLSSMVTVGLPYLIKVFLGLSNQLYGLAEGAMGMGSICGGLLVGRVTKKLGVPRSYFLILGSSLASVPLGLAVLTDQYPMASYGVILAGVAMMLCFSTLVSVIGQTLIQKLTPPELLGKVMSTVTVLCMCAMPLGQALYGALFDGMGRLSFLLVFCSGGVCALLALVMKRILRQEEFSL